MGNAPAGIIAAGLLPVCVRGDGICLEQADDAAPFDADMLAAGIHKRAGEHLVIPNIQACIRIGIRICRRPIQTLELIEVIDLLLHRRDGIRKLRGGVGGNGGPHLGGRHAEHHVFHGDLGHVQEALIGLIRIANIRMGAFMQCAH